MTSPVDADLRPEELAAPTIPSYSEAAMMMDDDSNGPTLPASCEHMTFTGQVSKADFLDWIAHRAMRLGLNGWVAQDRVKDHVVLVVQGPPELIDAMALACSLGPMTVWVEQVDRRPLPKPGEMLQGFQVLTDR